MLESLNSIAAEQAVLGSILYDPQCAELVMLLTASDFSVPEHCEIFSWVMRDVEDGRKPTALSVMTTLGNMRCGQVDGRTYIGRLAGQADRTTARENVHLIKDLSARRMMLGVGDVLRDCALRSEDSPANYSLQAIQALNDVIATGRKRAVKAQTVYEVASDLVDSLDDAEDGSIVSTGLRSLDKFMGGWPRGELSIIAGRPSMGKSAVLSAIARRGAKRGLNILIFSLEMPRKALVSRMLSDFVYSIQPDQQIPYSDIMQKRLAAMQKQRLISALEPFRSYAITIEDQRGLTMPEINLRSLRQAEKLAAQGKRLDVVMVDHIGKIRSGDRYRGNLVHETGEKSDALMNMAYEVDVAVVAAHQLNRNTEGREDKHPTPADLRDSGNLEQDAHTLIFPYRQSYYLERQKIDDPEKDRIRKQTLEKKKNLLEILVAKCRNGACGTVEVFVDMASNHVEDLIHNAERHSAVGTHFRSVG